MTLFELGRVEVRPAAAAALKANNLTADDLLSRHQQGDWGDVDEVGRQNNAAAVADEVQLYSLYRLGDGSHVVVETAWDRTVTAVFVDEEHSFEELDVRQGYAIWAATYDKGHNPLIEVEEAVVEELLESLPISSVLDVGAGTGRYALKLARRGAAVTAVDQSPEMLAVAQEAARTEGLNIQFRLASLGEELPFVAEQFDLLVCALVLAHIVDFDAAVQQFHQLLQADGHLLLTAFHPDIVAQGWRTIFDGPGITYGLPNSARTRADCLETLTASGFNLLHVIDIPLRDVKPGVFPETVMEGMGDVNFCLIILTQKS